MKLLKYSLLALATAFAFSSCDDDNKYVEGAQSPGAFFPKDAPEIVELPQTGNTVEVTIARTSLDDPSTYTIHGEDESGLFTFPTTVTFGPKEHTTTFTVTFDENEIITDELYPATVTVEGASVYGNQTYSFDFCRKSPLIITEMTGTMDLWPFTNQFVFDSKDPIEWCVSESDENAVTVRIQNFWDEGLPFIVTIDLSKEISDNVYLADLPYQETGGLVLNSDDGPVNYSSTLNFGLWMGQSLEWCLNKWPGCDKSCYYNASTGTLVLDGAFSCTDDPGAWYNRHVDVIQFDGFPDYSIDVEYLGIFIDTKGLMQAQATVTTGADVEEVRLVNIPGNDYEEGYTGIVEGTMKYESIKGSTEPQTVSFPITEAGQYTVVAVAYGDKSPQQFDYSTYKVNIGADDPNKGWKSLGQGGLFDVWSGYQSKDTGEPFVWYVEIQESETTPGLYRMVNPYGAGTPLSSLNTADGEAYIVFDATVPECITLEPQATGFATEEDGALSICNREGALYANGNSKEAIIANGAASTEIDGGVIVLNQPFFNYSIYAPDGWYSWKGQLPAEIYLPSALSVPAKRAIGTKATIEASKNAQKFKFIPMKRRYDEN